MNVLPAVDIMDGKVVQLVGGKPGTEKVSLSNPREVALSWQEKGAPGIHVVDLNAAMGRGDNFESIKTILSRVKVPIQIGGGIRTTDSVNTLLNLGAARVVVGTRAISDPDWLREIVTIHRNKVVLAIDVKGGKIQLKGWRESSEVSIEKILEGSAELPLAGVLHTNVDVEGKGAGIDKDEMRSFVSMCPHPVIASGGITTFDDISTLEDLGVKTAIVGLALYQDNISPLKVWGSTK